MKLTRRDSGNLISKAFLAETQSDQSKLAEKRKMDHSRMLREEERAEEEAGGAGARKTLETLKVDNVMVLDCKNKLLAHHFSMPSNVRSTINHLLSDSIRIYPSE